MFRAPVLIAGLILPAIALAQPPKPAPRELFQDGKSLTEWLSQLVSNDEKEERRATEAIRALAGQSDLVVERLLEQAANPATRRPTRSLYILVDLGPAAVPAVMRGLWSADEKVRRACLFVLEVMGADGRSAAASVERQLADSNDTVRVEAARTLGTIGAYASIPALKKLLPDPLAGVRYGAAQSLVRLGADANTLLPVFIADIQSDDPAARGRAIGLTGRLGPEAAPAVDALAAALPKADVQFTVAIADSLGSIGPAAKKAIPALMKKLADERGRAGSLALDVAAALWQIDREPGAVKLLREHVADARDPATAAAALWRMDRSEETIKALTELLKAEKPEIVIIAAGVLGERAKEAVPLLAKMLAHTDAKLRARSVVALVQLGPEGKGAMEALRGAVKDDNPLVAFWATVAVARLDPQPDAVAAVAGYLDDRDPEIRRSAAEVLGRLGEAGKAGSVRLTGALTGPDESLRLSAAAALWQLTGEPAALNAAVALLDSPNPRLRESAALELGATFGKGAKPAVAALLKRLFDPFAAVRSSTAEALGRIGPAAADAAPALLAVLAGDEPGFVQSAACEALGLVHPADKDAAVTVLKKKLVHPDALVRVHAALALWLIAEDRAGEKEAERALGNRMYQVRITAAEALWRIKQDARAVPLLVRVLVGSNLDGMEGDNERYMAVRALGRIGPPGKAAVEELKKLLTLSDPALAATAAGALKAIDGVRK